MPLNMLGKWFSVEGTMPPTKPQEGTMPPSEPQTFLPAAPQFFVVVSHLSTGAVTFCLTCEI